MPNETGTSNGRDISRLGSEIYQRVIQPLLRPQDQDKFVAIDIDSTDFEVDSDDFTATEQLLTRRPQAQIWLTRVGETAAYRIGAHRPGA